MEKEVEDSSLPAILFSEVPLVEVRKTPSKGRYLIAKVDIEPGSIILEVNSFHSEIEKTKRG